MKRTTIIVLALILVLALAGCKDKGGVGDINVTPDEGNGQSASEPADEPGPVTEEDDAGVTDGNGADSGAEPSDAQIEAAYQKADEAYRWFTMGVMPLAEDSVEYDGLTYQRVDFPGITSFAELQDYLLTLFAPNIAAGLVSSAEMIGNYREFDGVLYALAFDGVPGLEYGDTSSEIIRNDDGLITYRVTLEILGGENYDTVENYKVTDMTYHNPNGKWVFIWFEDIYYNG